MRLVELLTALGTGAPWGGETEIGGIAVDSRRVQPGDLFFALPGTRTDGRQHVAEAIARGARAVVTAGEIDVPGVPIVRSPTPARLLGLAAAHMAGDPSACLTLVGVTGTNGKTTTTYLLESIWRAAGLSPGVLGTIDYRFGGTSRPAPLTTPDALTLQTLLAEMRAAGATHVAMEVSSHALAQERVAGCRFDAAVFTNLTRDHMDFHADFDDYRRAKLRLFDEHLRTSGKPDPVAIVNADDPVGAALAADAPTRCVPYGRARYAAVRPLEVASTLAGTCGTLELGGTAVPFRSRLVGAPHVENILAAVATAWALGVDVEAIAAGVAEVSVPGRLEQIAGAGFSVLVDYAHTPDALARSLEVVRPLATGRVIVVFGCGGDRDRGKRPLMGEAAARLADLVVLTSDNPRTEEPARIIAEIEAGVRATGLTSTGTGRRYVIEPDRRAAIADAVALARAGDIVLVAGKGHEDYQIVGTEKRHLDDRQEVRDALAALGLEAGEDEMSSVEAGGAATFELAEVLAATGGELASLGSHTRFSGVTTDSRRLRSGELFVAIRGETHDGHEFLAEAAERGAGVVVVEPAHADRRLGCGVVVVRDTLAALGDLAAFHRRRHRPQIVAITGSNGKTTTKEMLSAILERAFGAGRVLRTVGTQNNLVGLPLTLLRLEGTERAAILELGMNGPGEIWRLAQIAEPDVGVITCVAPAHLEGLGSIHGVAEAKAELYRRLRPSATAVVNADDPLVSASAEAFPGRNILFGTTPANGHGAVAVAATDVVDHGLDGCEFRLVVERHEVPIRLAVPGRHNVTNALAAAAVAHALGVEIDGVQAGLEAFQPPGMRMEVTQLPTGVTVLNDAYNANPASMAAALRTLAASRGRRRVAVLGEMRELGSASAHAHHELGGQAAGANLDALFLLGTHADEVRAGAETNGMPADRIIVATSHEELGTRLRAYCRSGDLVLLKGSRGAAMERVLAHLRLEPGREPS